MVTLITKSAQTQLSMLDEYVYYEASRGAGPQRLTVSVTGCGCESHSRLLKYLFKFIFPFFRSGVQAKPLVASM